MGEGVDPEGLLDTSSEATSQSLFDPSKMVIAKVESLSDDSRFNDYLNEILESEEVMECLNSITIDSAPSLAMEPPQIQLHTHTPEVKPSEEDEEKSTCLSVAASSSSDVGAPPSTFQTTPTVALSNITSESVAAYVAAETNMVPFSVDNCFTTAGLESASAAHPPVLLSDSFPSPTPHLVTVVSEVSSVGRVAGPPSTASSLCGREQLGANVMWSQNSDVCKPNTSLEPSVESDSKRPGQELSVNKESESSKEKPPPTSHSQLAQECPPSQSIKPPAPPTSVSNKASTQPLRQKKVKVRVKRGPKAGNITAVPEQSLDMKKHAESSDTALAEAENGSAEVEKMAEPHEVKTRTGRAIKPSWKLVQSQPLRCTTSPKEKSPTGKETSGEKSRVVRPKSHTLQTGKACGVRRVKPRVSKSSLDAPGPSLSLAPVLGSVGLKRLPDIPGTLCGPNPPVPLPSATTSLSMSLNDILRQMNEDEEPQQQAIKFADSLLTTGAPPSNSRGCAEQQDREKAVEKFSNSSSVESGSAKSLSQSTGSVDAGKVCVSQSKPGKLLTVTGRTRRVTTSAKCEPSWSTTTEPAKCGPVQSMTAAKYEPVQSVTAAKYGPARCGPVQSTTAAKYGPARCGPVQSTTAAKCEPVKCESTTEANCGPVKFEPAKCGPVKFEPAKCGPVKFEPAKCGPTKCGPTVEQANTTAAKCEPDRTARLCPSPIQWIAEDSPTHTQSKSETVDGELIKQCLDRAAEDAVTDVLTTMDWTASETETASGTGRVVEDAGTEIRPCCESISSFLWSVSSNGGNEEEEEEENDAVCSCEREALSTVVVLEEGPQRRVRREGGGGDGSKGRTEEEDKIDIFADDFDTFTVYTMDEKTKKHATPPKMPSPPSELALSGLCIALLCFFSCVCVLSYLVFILQEICLQRHAK